MAESVWNTDPLKNGDSLDLFRRIVTAHSVQKNRYDALAYSYVLMNSAVRPKKKTDVMH
jgi:hypothetical protein